METIGSYEAKTHLAQLLSQVERGESFTITRHGRPVARLVPVNAEDRRNARESVERLLKRRQKLKGAPIDELIRSIHEGHRI